MFETKCEFPQGLNSVRENVCRPYGTRIYFPLYPALRLRLRAGLNYAAPMALDFRPFSSLANTKFGSHTLSKAHFKIDSFFAGLKSNSPC